MAEFYESIDSFKVIFGGENSIDAELFTKTINNTITLVKAAANAIDPNSFLRLEIKANQEGSFETIIDAIARHGLDLFTKDNARLACEIIGGLYAFLQIKKHLKGRKPKEIKSDGTDYKTIISQDNSILTIDKRFADAFINNSTIDNSITNIFLDQKEGKREGFSIQNDSGSKKISFPKEDFEIMSKKIIDGEDSPKGTEDTQTIENCELIIKKPDLLGSSKWELILDKKIMVTIEDEGFLREIKEGIIKISGGYRLICSLEIKREIDENYDVIKIEYSVKKVHATKDKKDQLELFN